MVAGKTILSPSFKTRATLGFESGRGGAAFPLPGVPPKQGERAGRSRSAPSRRPGPPQLPQPRRPRGQRSSRVRLAGAPRPSEGPPRADRRTGGGGVRLSPPYLGPRGRLSGGKEMPPRLGEACGPGRAGGVRPPPAGRALAPAAGHAAAPTRRAAPGGEAPPRAPGRREGEPRREAGASAVLVPRAGRRRRRAPPRGEGAGDLQAKPSQRPFVACVGQPRAVRSPANEGPPAWPLVDRPAQLPQIQACAFLDGVKPALFFGLPLFLLNSTFPTLDFSSESCLPEMCSKQGRHFGRLFLCPKEVQA